jgi:hypothetical protein
MFMQLRSGDDPQPLNDAEADDRLTMIVGRTNDFLTTLQRIGERPDRVAFLVDDAVLSDDQRARWFGADAADVLALLNFDAPERTAARRYHRDAEVFDIAQDLLNGEANQ